MEVAKDREIEKQKETKNAVNGLILKSENLPRNNFVRLGADLQNHILSFLFAVKIVHECPDSMLHYVLSTVCNGSEINNEINKKAVVPLSHKLKLLNPVYGKGGALTFFNNYRVLYKESIKQMIHNLLFHTNVDQTLTAFADLSPEGQFTVVELEDPHGQRIRGMAGEIVEAAGDHALSIKLRNCYKYKEEYDKRIAKWFHVGCDLFLESRISFKDISDTIKQNAENQKTPILIRIINVNVNEFYMYGCPKESKNWKLTRIKPSLKETDLLNNLPFHTRGIQRSDDRFNKLLVDTLKPGHALIEGAKEATENVMAPYRKAIRTLCQEIIESKNIPCHCSDATFKTLLDLPMAKKFRDALKPNPNHIVTSGLLFDMQIFLDFHSILKANREKLFYWMLLKTYLFIAIVYPALQARTQRIDYEIFKNGIKYVANGKDPYSIDFTEDVISDLRGFGKFHYFNIEGNKSAVGRQIYADWHKYYFLEIVSRKKNVSEITQSKQCVMM